MRWAYIFAVLNATVIGLSFMLIKQTLDFADPLDTLAYRFAAAFAILIVPAAFRWIRVSYKGKPLWPLLLLSSFYPLGYFTLQAFGMRNVTSAESGMISALSPIATLLLATLFLKEKTTLLQRASLLVSVGGLAFIFAMSGGLDGAHAAGMALLLLACFALAGYNVLARAVTKRFGATEISFFMIGAACVSFSAIAVAGHALDGSLGELAAPLANGEFVALIAGLGAIQIATSLMANYILSKMEASRMSVFAHLSTVVSIASGALFLHEAVEWYHLVGSALIIAGVVGTNRAKRRTTAPSQPSRERKPITSAYEVSGRAEQRL